MADDKAPRGNGLGDPVPNPAAEASIDTTLGSGAPDAVVLQGLSAESVGDPGSDDSPRNHAAHSAAGEMMNSGPTDADFTGSEEFASRAQSSQEPGRDAESGVPRHEAERAAPGDNLRR